MALDIDSQVGVTAVRPGYEIDEAALDRWMRVNVEGYAGPMKVEQFRGGQSNPTYSIATPGRRYVLRRKPSGPLLKGAHAVEREARVQQALGAAGFPVAKIHGLCTDDSVIGSWFYVMDLVDGRIFWDPAFTDVPADERPKYLDAMNATIARLHGIDYEAIGLGDYGRRGGYVERQIALWSRQYLADPDAGRDPNMDRLVEWLPRNLPGGETVSIVHGDFRADNMIFHPTEPRVVAVLDWELSTLGDPRADFSYHLMIYRMPSLATPGLADRDLAALNLPSEKDYLAAYAARTGRDVSGDLDYFLAYNFFRLAAIVHGIRGRVNRGNAANADAAARAARFEMLARLAWDQAVRAGAA